MSKMFAILLRFFGVGSVAGIIATIPMTLFMLLMQQLLPKWQKYALPPERIPTELTKRAEVGKHMNKPQQVGTALITHFGFGSSMGALSSPLSRRIHLPPALKGAIFGILVWAGSYLGIAPTLELSETAPEEPWQRNIMMIGAYLVWGTTLGITEDMLERAM